ncbi:MAG TPA: DnaJ C-terminal domain-containing protein [Phycisphaerales bacterium]|nr:DnaJ C-terminal domain-containing protein [Phycisphaerales bacterium]HMP36306.1 DnaJ C-terminal domain-containing protein [Phycisphaerales bacterium]
MAAPRDYYEVLGISRSATQEEIRKAHRALVRKLHPDVNSAPDAAAKFAEVQEAYDVLSSEEKRTQYDRFGHAGVGAAAAQGHAGAEGPFGGGSGSWHVDVDPSAFSEVFQEFFARGGAGGEARGSAGAGRRGASPFGGSARRGSAARGEDVELPIEVDFMSAALGGTRVVHLPDDDGGSSAIDVRIPAGIANGERLRLRGKGRPGKRGGEPGDVLLAVSILPHPWFRREGLDILLDVPISVAEASLGTAAMGTSVEVPLLRGSATLKVPAGTSSGQKLRLKGKGVVPARGGAAGDFLAVTQIVAPRSLEPDEEAAMRALGERLGNPRAETPWGRTLGKS